MSERPEDFPIVSGTYQMTQDWAINLGEQQFRRRFEDGQLVIWRPGITLWIAIWDYPASREEFEEEIRSRQDLPEDAQIIDIEKQNDTSYFGYKFKETDNDDTTWSLQTYTFGAQSCVFMAIYFDYVANFESAKSLWEGIEHGNTL